MAQLGPYQPPIHTQYGQWPHKYDILGFSSTVNRKRVVSLLNPLDPPPAYRQVGAIWHMWHLLVPQEGAVATPKQRFDGITR